MKSESKVAQSCLTLCNPTDCSLPGSSAHGISRARILEWVAIPFSRGSSQSTSYSLDVWFANVFSHSFGSLFTFLTVSFGAQKFLVLVESSLFFLWLLVFLVSFLRSHCFIQGLWRFHWLDGHESEWTPGVGDGQEGLVCCDSWGCKESDTTEQLIWSDLMLMLGLPWWLRW